MHRIAEEGIAAHWKYKAGDVVSAKDEQRLAWVRQLMEWQREMSDPNEFMSTLKIDLYPEEVYTFTPKGKVVVLPKDASPIDFAYAIHTEVGNTTIGAKVNGRIVPLASPACATATSSKSRPRPATPPVRDWLSFTKSSRARNKIKHWLNEHQRERAIEIGRKLIEREARKWKITLSKSLSDADYTPRRQRVWPRLRTRTASPASASASTPPASSSTSCSPALPWPRKHRDPEPEVPHGVTGRALADVRRGQARLLREGLATPSRSKARTISSSTAPAVATPSAARRSSATSPAARASLSTPVSAPTSRTSSTSPTAVSTSSGVQPKHGSKLAGDASHGKPTTYPVKLTILCDDRTGHAQGVHRHHLRRRHQHPFRRIQDPPLTAPSSWTSSSKPSTSVTSPSSPRTSAKSPASATSSGSRKYSPARPEDIAQRVQKIKPGASLDRWRVGPHPPVSRRPTSRANE